MATEIEASWLMTLNAARLKVEGRPCLKEASMAKLFASEMAERVCSWGHTNPWGLWLPSDFAVERHYRDARFARSTKGRARYKGYLLPERFRRKLKITIQKKNRSHHLI